MARSNAAEMRTATGARTITNAAFRARFTLAEKVAIDLASINDPAADLATRQAAARIRVYWADFDSMQGIDPEVAVVRSHVTALETATLIGSGRALVILDTAPDRSERP